MKLSGVVATFRRSPIVLLFLVGMVLVPLRAQPQQGAFEQYNRERPALPPIKSSPSGRIIVDHLFRDAESPRQIWLRDARGALEPELLYEYPRSADVLFSPDEGWVAVNDYAGSNVAQVLLFRRSGGLKFREETSADVHGPCWRLLRRIHRTPSSWDPDPAYTEALRWAPGSQALLLVLWGHTDGDNFLDDWLCVYDLRTRQASRISES